MGSTQIARRARLVLRWVVTQAEVRSTSRDLDIQRSAGVTRVLQARVEVRQSASQAGWLALARPPAASPLRVGVRALGDRVGHGLAVRLVLVSLAAVSGDDVPPPPDVQDHFSVLALVDQQSDLMSDMARVFPAAA